MNVLQCTGRHLSPHSPLPLINWPVHRTFPGLRHCIYPYPPKNSLFFFSFPRILFFLSFFAIFFPNRSFFSGSLLSQYIGVHFFFLPLPYPSFFRFLCSCSFLFYFLRVIAFGSVGVKRGEERVEWMKGVEQKKKGTKGYIWWPDAILHSLPHGYSSDLFFYRKYKVPSLSAPEPKAEMIFQVICTPKIFFCSLFYCSFFFFFSCVTYCLKNLMTICITAAPCHAELGKGLDFLWVKDFTQFRRRGKSKI